MFASLSTRVKAKKYDSSLLALLCALICPALPAAAADRNQRPNILIFYLDDMGWRSGLLWRQSWRPRRISTHGAGGVRFTDGYVYPHCICAPSRVGLMTDDVIRPAADTTPTAIGRGARASRQRYDHRSATQYRRLSHRHRRHVVLGQGPDFLPAARGFDFSIGSVGNLGEGSGPSFYRGKELIDEWMALRSPPPFTRGKRVDSLRREKDQHLVSVPGLQCRAWRRTASDKWLERFKDLSNRDRQNAGLVAEADEAVGTVLGKLRELKLEENTLIFLIGGQWRRRAAGRDGRACAVANGSSGKGGIRVPWIVQWKGHIEGGRVSSEPVIQLDVLPTAWRRRVMLRSWTGNWME